MPKRKAPTKISGLVGSDDEDLVQIDTAEAPAQEENPAKKRRGRPRTSNDTGDAKTTQTKNQESAQADSAAAKKPGRRGRPRGSSRTSESAEVNTRASARQEPADENSYEQENEDPQVAPTAKPIRATKATKAAPAPTRRGRGRAASTAKPAQADGEFEYTPTTARQSAHEEQPPNDPAPSPRPRGAQRRKNEANTASHQTEEAITEVVDESVLPDEEIESAPFPTETSNEVAKNARARINALRNGQELSPRKRKSGVESDSGDPDLRRKIGDLTKKHDALESRYRSLREIGVVEANSNIEKLRKQCETITTASNTLVASLKAELEAQRALGQQSRGLQKQLKDQENEMTRLKVYAEESKSQLTSAQTEVKALQTKLAAARNTAAAIESSAKAPGSAIKGGPANRANAAASAEAAQAAQIAQLKEDLFSDLTGLIVRDVKARESDYLYDCIQTGVNGSLHFKLAVPKESTADYDTAEFQYLPLLDANRDRDLLNILPEFLSVDITFARQQASKFYTRVIDALTKRRVSTTS